jgi:hypothetical protein
MKSNGNNCDIHVAGRERRRDREGEGGGGREGGVGERERELTLPPSSSVVRARTESLVVNVHRH